NNSEANSVAGSTHAWKCHQRIGVEHDVFGGQRSSRCTRTSLQKSTARETSFDHTAISSVVIESFLFQQDKQFISAYRSCQPLGWYTVQRQPRTINWSCLLPNRKGHIFWQVKPA